MIPWRTGLVVCAAAQAMAAKPRTDSFQNTPCATPKGTAAATAAPAEPPAAAAGVNAWVKMRPMAEGTSVILMTIRTIDKKRLWSIKFSYLAFAASHGRIDHVHEGGWFGGALRLKAGVSS